MIPTETDVVPDEYILYRFCEKFHCLPEDVNRMDAALYSLWLHFMNAEAEAGRIKGIQASVYG